jgi:hypothetical protein
MSLRALTAMALSWLGRTLISTTVVKSPRMKITTISSTRLKPLRTTRAALQEETGGKKPFAP